MSLLIRALIRYSWLCLREKRTDRESWFKPVNLLVSLAALVQVYSVPWDFNRYSLRNINRCRWILRNIKSAKSWKTSWNSLDIVRCVVLRRPVVRALKNKNQEEKQHASEKRKPIPIYVVWRNWTKMEGKGEKGNLKRKYFEGIRKRGEAEKMRHDFEVTLWYKLQSIKVSDLNERRVLKYVFIM